MASTNESSHNEGTPLFLAQFVDEEKKLQRKHENDFYRKSVSNNVTMEKRSMRTESHNGSYARNESYSSIVKPTIDPKMRSIRDGGQTSSCTKANGTKSNSANVEWSTSSSGQIKELLVRNRANNGNRGIFMNGCSAAEHFNPRESGVAHSEPLNGLLPAYSEAASTLLETCIATHASNNTRSMTHKQWLRHTTSAGQKFFSEKKSLEQCAVETSRDSINRAQVAMNASPLSASPAAQATDLSQHSGILHRDDNSKVYPHIIVPPYSLDQRRGLHEQTAKSRDGFHDEKKLSLDSFKHSVWGGFPNTSIFSDPQQQNIPHQQTPYETAFYPEVNPSGIPHPQARHYDVNPILLKDPNIIPMVKEEGHHGNMTWEKPAFDRMLGGYKQVRGQCYLKPPPVDLDEVSAD